MTGCRWLRRDPFSVPHDLGDEDRIQPGAFLCPGLYMPEPVGMVQVLMTGR